MAFRPLILNLNLPSLLVSSLKPACLSPFLLPLTQIYSRTLPCNLTSPHRLFLTPKMGLGLPVQRPPAVPTAPLHIVMACLFFPEDYEFGVPSFQRYSVLSPE